MMKVYIAVLAFVALVSAIPIDKNGMFTVPMIGKVPQECVHRVPSGSHVVHTDEGISVQPPFGEAIFITSCNKQYGDQFLSKKNLKQYDGWLAYTGYESSTDLDYFLGYFDVPDAPQSTPEVLYLFTGLQNVNWIPVVDPPPSAFDIIQPVLQYPGDNGNYWSVKSWYVTLTSDVLYSDEIQVNTGDNIFGNMTKSGTETWFIGGSDGGQQTNLTVTRDLLATQPWAYNTAECYGCEGCSYEPTQPIHFTQLRLQYQGQQIVPSWTPYQSPNPQCHETATVVDPATVNISFQ